MAKASSLYPGVTIETPLSGKDPIQADGVTITELPFLGKVTLRGNAADPVFAAAVKSVLGADLKLYRIFLTFLLKYDVTLYTDRR